MGWVSVVFWLPVRAPFGGSGRLVVVGLQLVWSWFVVGLQLVCGWFAVGCGLPGAARFRGGGQLVAVGLQLVCSWFVVGWVVVWTGEARPGSASTAQAGWPVAQTPRNL